jgi:hypothetical protein
MLTVFTSIVGNRACLCDQQQTGGNPFVAFVDKAWQSRVWLEKPAYSGMHSARRNSRAPKILSHNFVETEYSLWIDGSVKLKVDPQRLVDEWLQHADVAMFAHDRRSCTYMEAETCAVRGLDQPELIREQAASYKRRGLPENIGLPETTVILRKHTTGVRYFNCVWWSEYCKYSVRDQISVMYAAFATGTHINMIRPTKLHHPYFEIISKPAEPEPFRQK